MGRLPQGWSPLLLVWLLLAGSLTAACARPSTPNPSGMVATPQLTAGPETVAPSTIRSEAPVQGCGELIDASAPSGLNGVPLAVVASDTGLELYDVNNDQLSSAPSGVLTPRAGPQFRTPSEISYIGLREERDDLHLFGQDSIYVYDLARARNSELLRHSDRVLAYEWSPDGVHLAYLLRSQTATDVLPVTACVLDTHSRDTSLLRQLGLPIGTATDQRQETAIRWSPSGRHLLVTDTSQQPSLLVIDVEGRDAMIPEIATFGRWLSAEDVLFQRDPQDVTKPWNWLVASLPQHMSREFALPSEAFRPAISPQLDLLAYDDGAAHPSLFIADVRSGNVRLLAEGLVAPVWLTANTVAATEAVPCSSQTACPAPWTALRRTMAIDVDTGTEREIALPTTLQDGLSRGVIDTWMAPTGS